VEEEEGEEEEEVLFCFPGDNREHQKESFEKSDE